MVSRRSIDTLFHARSLAIVGASERGGYTASILANLERSGYEGNVYLVNPRREKLFDRTCFPDLSALPERPDHVAVAVAASAVCGVVEQALAAGVPSGVIYATGVGDGEDQMSRDLGRQLVQLTADRDFAFTGPNCLGNFCARPGFTTLTATEHVDRSPGPVAVIGQSGGAVLFMAKALRRRGCQVGYAATSGNELCLTVGDLIGYLAGERDVEVVVAFVEAIRDRGSFVAACELARRQDTHVVIVKSGNTRQARAAAMAHTGALVGSTEAFDALCEELGVVRAETLDDALEAAEFLAHTGVPRGDGIAAVTYSGGLRAVLLDQADRFGLAFPPLSPRAQDRLNELLPFGGGVGNPLDVGFLGLASPDVYARCVEVLMSEPHIDVVFAQELLPEDDVVDPRSVDHLEILSARAKDSTTRVAAFSMVKDSVSDYGREFRARVPNVAVLQGVQNIFTVMSAIGRATAAIRRDESPETPLSTASRSPDAVDISLVRNLVERAERRPERAMTETEAKEALAAAGIPLPKEHFATNQADVAAIADGLRYPVALKAVSAQVTHKSDLGLVALELDSPRALLDAHRSVTEKADLHGIVLDGVIISPMADDGVELLVSVHRDTEAGPVAILGAGGLTAELYRDVAYGVAGITTQRRVVELLARTRAGQLLLGYRDLPEGDVAAVADVLTRMAALADAFRDEITTIEINPLRVHEKGQGVSVLDALITV